MAWEQLKAEIAQTIKTNGNQEITGAVMQQELYRMIDALGNPTGFKIATYLEEASDPFVLTGGEDNKLSLPVSVLTSPLPSGFDLYVTPQGSALRFIGSGLGNGDVAVLIPEAMASLQATFGSSDKVTFMAKTRHYTETEWTNATLVPGFKNSAKMANNSLVAISLNAPFITMNDGDLLEIAINPSDDITVVIDSFAFKIVEYRG